MHFDQEMLCLCSLFEYFCTDVLYCKNHLLNDDVLLNLNDWILDFNSGNDVVS